MEKKDAQVSDKILKGIQVTHLMSRFAITTTEDASLADLAHLLMRFKISGVPVIDSSGKISGIVTATDLFKLMANVIEDIDKNMDPVDYGSQSVHSIMTKEVHTISETDSLYDVMKLMCQKNIHTLPVISDGNIVGVIGRRDALNACYASLYFKPKMNPSNKTPEN